MTQGSSGVRTTRRGLLAGATIVAVTALTGCDVRLQRNAPRVPGLTTQGPPSDDLLLTATLDRLRTLTTAARRVSSPAPRTSAGRATAVSPPTPQAWAARLAAVHARQAARVEQILASSGITVPTATPSAAAATAAGPARHGESSSAPMTPGTGTIRGLRDLELEGLHPSVLDGVARATRADLPMLGAIGSVEGAAATVLGADPEWRGTDAVSAPMAAALLLQVQPCVYALEQIAATTPLQQRTLVTQTLTTMYAARGRLVTAAGASAPPPSADYRLPFAVTDSASRPALARLVLGRVVTAAAAQSPAAAGQEPRTGAVIRLWAEALAASWRWGTPLAPFPGLLTG